MTKATRNNIKMFIFNKIKKGNKEFSSDTCENANINELIKGTENRLVFF